MSGSQGAFLNALDPLSGMTNPFEFSNQVSQARKNALDVQNLQGQQAWGNALLKNTDANGNVDYQGAARDAAAAGGPAAAMAARSALGDMATQRTQQINNAAGMYKTVGIGTMSLAKDPSDQNVDAVSDNLIASGLPAAQVNAERARLKAMALPDRQTYAVQHGNAALDALHQVIGQTTLQNVGGTVAPVTVNQPTANSTGSATVGPGSIPTTPTPESYMGGAGITYQATQADVDAGTKGPDGKPVHIGQTIVIPGAEVYRRMGIPVPPGLGGGGGVTDSDGKPVSPTNPPRLLKVPSQTTAPSPPAATTASPLPIPPVPPTVVPPPSTATTAPPVAAPVPAAPAALPAPPGAVWNPNNPVGTSTVVPSAPLLPVGPRASLQGGVPVASATNALQPNVGEPGPSSALVPGDVNAIQAGMDRARATPAAGTQSAFNSIAVGPGSEEAVGYKASADKLAADDLAATNFQQTQFPYVQALKNYGEGTKTGPTTDFWNQVAGSIRTPLAKIGINVGALSDTTTRVDALGKWLASIQSGNPISAKSDAELAQVLKGSASTHINEVAGEDMVKAGYGLMTMQNVLNREWHNNPQMQQQYGTYLNYLGDMNSKVDPRAFIVDNMNDAQKQRLQAQLKNGTEADAARYNASRALLQRNAQSGSQAVP